jgi:hypothetical protein
MVVSTLVEVFSPNRWMAIRELQVIYALAVNLSLLTPALPP